MNGKTMYICDVKNNGKMDERNESAQKIDVCVSVDCVLVGFDGEQLRILLVRQVGEQADDVFNNMKLPGSLIYVDEDLDDAAKRVLSELTGLKNIKMMQFKAYGSTLRTSNPKDVLWLERFHRLRDNKVGRIVTIAYLSLLNIDRHCKPSNTVYAPCWTPVSEIGSLAFDHTQICKDALSYVRHYVEKTPSAMFDLLPRKFTVAQLHALYQLIYDKKYDIRNFHKKIMLIPYVVPLEEKETGVRHRAARYFKFDRNIYKKQKR